MRHPTRRQPPSLRATEFVDTKRLGVLAAVNGDEELSQTLNTVAAVVETALYDRALGILHAISGANTAFRPGQWEAIESLVAQKRRVLVVQRTGWGKSAVYLIATRLLRDAGRGPTLIVSPLLALMRNQLDMATRGSVRAETINSTNPNDWPEIEHAIAANEIDLLLISPERLNNPEFVRNVLPGVLGRIGLLVVDEVHCISDWGHDFRPDYRLLSRVVASLPPNTPVLGTTATANDRVVADVVDQFGSDLSVSRGSLDRESLVLQVINLPNKVDRLGWLAQEVPRMQGSGIIYCLTVRDAELVSSWLQSRGMNVRAYTGQSEPEDRLAIEGELSRGDLKAVVATSALGMGYDNPFIEFVIHFQSPGSPIFYYQQVGRAGRATDRSLGILLTGAEDREIQNHFITSAFPSEEETIQVLRTLATGPLGTPELERTVNLQHSRIESLLKVLEVEGAVYREQRRWHRSATVWHYPTERVRAITESRRAEQQAMVEYAATSACLMEYLRRELDDQEAVPCGRCANCLDTVLVPDLPSDDLRQEAARFLGRSWLEIPGRKQWPAGLGFSSLRKSSNEPGRALSRWNDPGWGRIVAEDKYGGNERVRDELIDALTAMFRDWSPAPPPTWVTCVPDRTTGGFVTDCAQRLATALALPFVPAVIRVSDRPRQKVMNNSYQQANNVAGAFEVFAPEHGPVLLIDDMVDSGWTFTYIGMLLREAGVARVYPLALADTSRSDG